MMEDDKQVAHDVGDSDLSFESLTFGDSHNDHQQDKNGQQGLNKKKDKFRKKFSTNKKDAPHTPEGEKSSSVYITTQDDKLDVQALLRKLEHFGAVRGYYFKEKQNFGIVQFVDPSIVDAVIDAFSTGDSGFRVTVERTSRAKEFHASPHSFGSIPPSLSSTPVISVTSPPTTSTPPPPEKPDTILVLKNLPFTLKQDQLHEILLSLSTTIPQSISLHYDNGVFKGMAFIKYRQLEDAIQVYELLNGMDVGGRKVRVEYKRKPAAKALTDIPVEWQEDEELRKLWEQLKEFKEDANQTEWYYPPTLTNNQKRNIYNMTERLKLVQGTTGEGELRVYLRKTPNPPVSPAQDHGHNGHSGGSMESKGRGIDIKGRRTRHDSDAASRSGAASPNDRERMGRNSVGRNEGNKHSIASSAPADLNLDWRSNQSSQTGGSSYNSYNNHAQFAHNMQIHHQQQQQQQSQQQQQTALLAPLRQPKGPDGSKGFDAPRRAAATPFLLPTTTTTTATSTTEVSAS